MSKKFEFKTSKRANIIAVLIILGLVLILILTAPIPTFKTFHASNKSSEAQLLDRNGTVLQRLRLDPHQRVLEWVPLENISPALLRSVIAAEDKRFYYHPGIDPIGFGAALLDNFHRARPRGASTLTMQLASLIAEPNKRHSGLTKLRQVRDALAIEMRWSKRQILEAYLNRVAFRGELVGISAASRGLLNKGPSGLNQADSAVLAALIRAPAATRNTVGQRACAVLKTLNLPQECEHAVFVAAGLPKHPYPIQNEDDAPHLARQLLHHPGESVSSTLDASLQRFATETLRTHLAELSDRNVEDGAVLVLDNQTGHVLAYVGSSGDLSGAAEVNGVTALRQPGSTLKPFLYGLAIDQHWLTAASILDDSPLALTTPSGLYIPQDYDKHFRGAVSVRTALGSSLNVPAVRALSLVGLDRFLQTLHGFGLDSLSYDAEHYGYGLALGGAETNLLTLTNAYRTLANEGRWTPIHFISEHTLNGSRQTLSPQTAFIISDILADPAARALTFGLSSPLSTRTWAAVKTGTSKGMRDNWTIGFTSRFTVGVWVGNFSGAPMWDVSGITGAAPIWRDIVEHLHENLPSEAPPAPPGLIQRQVVFRPAIEAPRSEWYLLPSSQPDSAGLVQAQPPQTPLKTTILNVAATPDQIIAPPDSAILAPDPDIPQHLQSLLIQANSNKPACLRLDGKVMAQCGILKTLLPLPMPGKHCIELTTKSGHLLDRHTITVRGLAR